MTDEITIRRAETPADYRALQQAQRLAWGIVEDSYVLPVSTMVGASHHGGIVLGAFLASGEAIGLSFGFLGRIGDRIGLYSQLTGVIPGYQSMGLGYRMKMIQRDYCRAEGLPVIAWTFDPMQGGNARFNLNKLGATGTRLILDMYGARTDALSAGFPSDRLVVEWEINAQSRPEPTAEDLANLPRVARDGDLPDRPYSVGAEGPRVFLEIPESINRLRADAPTAALAWQVVATNALAQHFGEGYRAVGFGRIGGGRCGYVLEKP